MSEHDPVNRPKHYTGHPSGIECIQVTEHMGFCIGNAVKYLWRADLKGNALEDLRKAAWYVQREIERRTVQAEREQARPPRPLIDPEDGSVDWCAVAADRDVATAAPAVVLPCAHRQPTMPGFYCEKAGGHDGDHMARGILGPPVSWPRDPAPANFHRGGIVRTDSPALIGEPADKPTIAEQLVAALDGIQAIAGPIAPSPVAVPDRREADALAQALEASMADTKRLKAELATAQAALERAQTEGTWTYGEWSTEKARLRQEHATAIAEVAALRAELAAMREVAEA